MLWEKLYFIFDSKCKMKCKGQSTKRAKFGYDDTILYFVEAIHYLKSKND